MGVIENLSPDRVSVANEIEGNVRSKDEALKRLSILLAKEQTAIDSDEIERVLRERERLQSTGVGGGVAIPHGHIDRLDGLIGAVLLCPKPIPFDAIDGQPVTILFALIGPKRAAGQHLKALARISRLLRDDSFRERLLSTPSGVAAFRLIADEEAKTAT